jgi:hypothetical protein
VTLRKSWWRWAPWISIATSALAIGLTLLLVWQPFPGIAFFALLLLAFGLALVPMLTSLAGLVTKVDANKSETDAAIAGGAICGMLLLAAATLPPANPAPSRPEPGASAPKAVWAELMPEGSTQSMLARAIIGANEACPALTIDGKDRPMGKRADSDVNFPVTVCELAYSEIGTDPPRIGAIQLQKRPEMPRRILVFGDSGCRITYYGPPQRCNDPEAWPLQRLAQAAADKKPDLVIHVGDYNYREARCSDQSGCGNSPFGDNWATWSAEFFQPAAALLVAAPWVMLRGNHEDCERAGFGWFLLLAPGPGSVPPQGCTDTVDPYRVRFAADDRKLTLEVLDTAHAGAAYDPKRRSERYRRDFGRFFAEEPGPARTGVEETWVLMHQPLWVFTSSAKTDGGGWLAQRADPLEQVRKLILERDDWDQQTETVKDIANRLYEPLAAIRPLVTGTKSPIRTLLLSGDTHNFQLFQPIAGGKIRFPVQLVVGTGGTQRDPVPNHEAGPPICAEMSGAMPDVARGLLDAVSSYGFLLLTLRDEPPHWRAEFFQDDGELLLRRELPRPGESISRCLRERQFRRTLLTLTSAWWFWGMQELSALLQSSIR